MKKYELFVPWLIALIATVGSLFISEYRHEAPCTLCWYQRVIMFPLAIILGIAAFRKAYRIVYYVLPLAVIGLFISGYHAFLIRFFPKTNFCAECTLKGTAPTMATFPILSFLAFLVLTSSLLWIAFNHRHAKKL